MFTYAIVSELTVKFKMIVSYNRQMQPFEIFIDSVIFMRHFATHL